MSRVVSTSKLAPAWLHKSEQPITSRASKLTQLLTMTTTYKFPPQEIQLVALAALQVFKLIYLIVLRTDFRSGYLLFLNVQHFFHRVATIEEK